LNKPKMDYYHLDRPGSWIGRRSFVTETPRTGDQQRPPTLLALKQQVTLQGSAFNYEEGLDRPIAQTSESEPDVRRNWGKKAGAKTHIYIIYISPLLMAVSSPNTEDLTRTENLMQKPTYILYISLPCGRPWIHWLISLSPPTLKSHTLNNMYLYALFIYLFIYVGCYGEDRQCKQCLINNGINFKLETCFFLTFILIPLSSVDVGLLYITDVFTRWRVGTPLPSVSSAVSL